MSPLNVSCLALSLALLLPYHCQARLGQSALAMLARQPGTQVKQHCSKLYKEKTNKDQNSVMINSPHW